MRVSRAAPLAEREDAVAVDRSLRAGILRHAAASPDRIALRLPGHDISYAELVDTARRWAALLCDMAGGRLARVGVFAARNATAYAGVLAALCAGAAFVPLSRRFPPARTHDMMARAGLDAIVADAESLPQLLVMAGGLERAPPLLAPFVADAALRGWPARAAGRQAAAASAPLAALPDLAPDDLAYLLFTSGSTGQPKGVAITQANIRAFLDVSLARYRLTPDDRLSQNFEPTFDLSVFDMFMAWESGASLCPLRPVELLAPAAAVARLGLTVWFSVPSVATRLLARGALPPDTMPGLRWSLFCGEALPQATAQAWQAAAPNAVLENLYGPTELTVACAAYRWDARHSPAQCAGGLAPIGRIYPGLSWRILDASGQEAGPGVAGELAVAGAQTSPGYWRAPELTAERFVTLGGRRHYLTGDIVRRQRDNLIFLGRADSQVKIGGYRIELGEIEAQLRLAGCDDAVALAWPATAPAGIVAVVTGAVATGAVATGATATGAVTREADVMARLEQTLPAHMLPRSLHRLDAFPLNAHGKTDRAALRDWLAPRVTADGAAA